MRHMHYTASYYLPTVQAIEKRIMFEKEKKTAMKIAMQLGYMPTTIKAIRLAETSERIGCILATARQSEIGSWSY